MLAQCSPLLVSFVSQLFLQQVQQPGLNGEMTANLARERKSLPTHVIYSCSQSKFWSFKKRNSKEIYAVFMDSYTNQFILEPSYLLTCWKMRHIGQAAMNVLRKRNVFQVTTEDTQTNALKKFKKEQAAFRLNLLHPNISMHILHTVLYTFPEVLSRRICLTVRSFFSW